MITADMSEPPEMTEDSVSNQNDNHDEIGSTDLKLDIDKISIIDWQAVVQIITKLPELTDKNVTWAMLS